MVVSFDTQPKLEKKKIVYMAGVWKAKSIILSFFYPNLTQYRRIMFTKEKSFDEAL